MRIRVTLLAGLAVLMILVAAVVVLAPGAISAQQPPPDPTALGCCEVLATSQRTIAGPGRQANQTEASSPLFYSAARKVFLCATVRNVGATDLIVGSFGLRDAEPEHSLLIRPGQTRTFCDDTWIVKVICAGCSYQWRIDRAD